MFNPLGAGLPLGGRDAAHRARATPCWSSAPASAGWRACIAARAAGADRIIVTGLTRDARKLALARELGADHVIDVEHEDSRRRVRELTDGRGADVVVEVSSYATEPVAEALCSPRRTPAWCSRA